MKRITFILALLVFASALARGQAGYLDKTFGDGGVMRVPLPAGKNFYALDVKILPDGKIIQSGVYYDAGSFTQNLCVVKHNKNGTLDSSFGNDGFSSLILDMSVSVGKLLAYPDGRVLLYGDVHIKAERRPLIIRFLANGKVDSSFGDKGIYSETKFIGYFHRLKIEDDGHIIALGGRSKPNSPSGVYSPIITRLTSAGKKDFSFGTSGIVFIGAERDTGTLHDAIFYKDSLCIFSFSTPSFPEANLQMLFTKINGVIDSAYGDNGIISSQLSDDEDYIESFLGDYNNYFLCLVGIKRNGNYEHTIVKLSDEGELDNSFGHWGITQDIDPRYDQHFNVITMDSNKNILQAGRVIDLITASNWLLTARYLHNGRVDSSYGYNGMSDALLLHMKSIEAIAIQSDGKYIVLGTDFKDNQSTAVICRLVSYGATAVARLNENINAISLHPTPSLDNCTVTYTLPASSDCSLTLRDESGREVRTLVTSEFRASGKHQEELDLRGLASGVYFLEIESGGTIQTAKLIKQ
ncbi:MAG TPA: T9SS type A sorting domain-containing protein [Candidatus Kapabacteria bacterium]